MKPLKSRFCIGSIQGIVICHCVKVFRIAIFGCLQRHFASIIINDNEIFDVTSVQALMNLAHFYLIIRSTYVFDFLRTITVLWFLSTKRLLIGQIWRFRCRVCLCIDFLKEGDNLGISSTQLRNAIDFPS